MSLNKASIAVALAAFLAVGGIAGQALAAPHDGHDGRGRIRTAFTRRSRRKRNRSTMPS